MLDVSPAATLKPSSFVGPQTSVKADVKCSAEVVAKASVDDYVTIRKVGVSPIDPQTYKSE